MFGKAKEITERMRVFLHTTSQPLQTFIGVTELLIQETKKQRVDNESLLEELTLLKDAGDNMATHFKKCYDYLNGKEAEGKLRVEYTREEFFNYIKGHIIPASRRLGIGHELGKFDLPDENLFIQESFLYNTILNLVKNSKEAGSQKFISSYWTDPNSFFMSFKDDGKGMDFKTLKRCLDKGYTTKAGGQGIGLGYLKSDMDLRGGSIDVQSGIDKGTTITLIQPLKLYYPSK